MKIKSKSKKPLTIALLAAGLVGILAAAFIVYLFIPKSSSNDEAVKPNIDNNSQTKVASKDSPSSSEDKEEPPNTDQPVTPVPDASSQKKRVQMVVSVNISNGVVYIRGGANYPMLSEGMCYANLSGPSGQAVRKDTILLQNPSSTDCKTISVPVSELTTGDWTASLHYSSDTYEGDSSEAKFSIN